MSVHKLITSHEGVFNAETNIDFNSQLCNIQMHNLIGYFLFEARFFFKNCVT